MQGSRTLGVSVQQAWEALNDPAMLQVCIPGCEKFERTDPDTYSVTTAIRIGPVAARFNGKVRLADIVPMQSYTLVFEAQGGVAGFGKGEAAVQLQSVEAGCELAYRVHSTVGGKLAQLGQRLIEGVSRSLAEDFFRRFDEALASRYAGEGATSAPAEPATAARPAGLPAWAWVAIAAALAILTYLGAKG